MRSSHISLFSFKKLFINFKKSNITEISVFLLLLEHLGAHVGSFSLAVRHIPVAIWAAQLSCLWFSKCSGHACPPRPCYWWWFGPWWSHRFWILFWFVKHFSFLFFQGSVPSLPSLAPSACSLSHRWSCTVHCSWFCTPCFRWPRTARYFINLWNLRFWF